VRLPSSMVPTWEKSPDVQMLGIELRLQERNSMTRTPFSTSRVSPSTGSSRGTQASLDVVEALFARKATRAAARAFLEWFRKKGGRCSPTEMSAFADRLASGGMSCRLARQNFYRTVLKRFVDYGLIALVPEYDGERRRIMAAYHAVTQPITTKRPPGPSLIQFAHMIGETWNRSFEDSCVEASIDS
jgi:hypothetical protein